MYKRSLVIILLLAAGLFVPAASAHAQTRQPQGPSNGLIGIRLLDAPVARQDDPRAQTYIVDHLAQGTTITRHIEVTNSTTNPQSIVLYGGSATIKDGTFAGDPGQGGNDLTSWMAVAPGQVAIPPGGRQQATVTINVPAGVPDGERYGVVWAERVSSSAEGGVFVINRVGVRIYLSVGVGAEPTSDFAIESFTAQRLQTGEPAMTAMVRNTGGRALDLSGKLDLKDGPGGLNAGPFLAELGTTLGIGQSAPVMVKLDKRIPAGPWNAVIDLKSGNVEHSAQARITFPASGAAKPVKANSIGDKVKILLPILAIILALIAGLIIAVRRRRKDNYKQVKGDLKRFEKIVKAMEGGAAVPTAEAEDPVHAIRAAIKQADRAGDEKTAAKLESRLNELLERRTAASALTELAAATAVEVEPEPHVEVDDKDEIKLRDNTAELLGQETAPNPPPMAPPPAPDLSEVVPVANGGGDVTPASPPPGTPESRSLAVVLRELAAAPPGAGRFALIREARAHGLDVIEAHPDELAAIPEDLRNRLLRSPNGNGNGAEPHAAGDGEPASQGSEIA